MASLPVRGCVYVYFTSGDSAVAALVKYGGLQVFINQRSASATVDYNAPTAEHLLKYCRQFGDPHEIKVVARPGEKGLALSPKEFADRFVPFKRPNLWIEHVKETQKRHGGTYRQALHLATKTWAAS